MGIKIRIAVAVALLVLLGACGHRVTSGTIIQKQSIPAHLSYGQTTYCAHSQTTRSPVYSRRSNGSRYISGYSSSTRCTVWATRSYSYMVDSTYGFRLRDDKGRLGYDYVSPYTFDRYSEGQQYP